MGFNKLVTQHFNCMGNGIMDDPYLNYGTLQGILYTPMASGSNNTTLWHAIQLTTGKMCFIIQNHASGTYTIITHKHTLFKYCKMVHKHRLQAMLKADFYHSVV